jgi:hypothetical protein
MEGLFGDLKSLKMFTEQTAFEGNGIGNFFHGTKTSTTCGTHIRVEQIRLYTLSTQLGTPRKNISKAKMCRRLRALRSSIRTIQEMSDRKKELVTK